MPTPWKISLHGGHSGDFCEHGHDTLRVMLDAAVEYGYSTFGVTAHAPANGKKFLYEEEKTAGLTYVELERTFSSYVQTVNELATEFAGRLEVLRGAEVEVVPEASFAANAIKLKKTYSLDYLVGSVHWVDEMPFDTSQEDFDKAVANRGGLEPFLLRYYELLGEMIEQVKPEIVGHFDLPRLYSDGASEHETAGVNRAINDALQKAKTAGCILDLNVSALPKGLSSPYPAPWIVKQAMELGVPFSFGDDSHSSAQVGANIKGGRHYLIDQGVETITTLTHENSRLVKKQIPLH
ncbi:MAG: histidinol-phosphatase [Dehalococcoidia bacterium]|nr:histidinol-phosphatase [Dehalococcoidia bacterium]